MQDLGNLSRVETLMTVEQQGDAQISWQAVERILNVEALFERRQMVGSGRLGILTLALRLAVSQRQPGKPLATSQDIVRTICGNPVHPGPAVG